MTPQGFPRCVALVNGLICENKAEYNAVFTVPSGEKFYRCFCKKHAPTATMPPRTVVGKSLIQIAVARIE